MFHGAMELTSGKHYECATGIWRPVGHYGQEQRLFYLKPHQLLFSTSNFQPVRFFFAVSLGHRIKELSSFGFIKEKKS